MGKKSESQSLEPLTVEQAQALRNGDKLISIDEKLIEEVIRRDTLPSVDIFGNKYLGILTYVLKTGGVRAARNDQYGQLTRKK
jgi:hypothetical protein